jgi:hypothetical protein
LAVLGEAFDGEDFAAIGLDGEHRAALDGLTVHMNSAGAAKRGLASDMRTGESGDIAEIVDEEQARLHVMGIFFPVDGEIYGSFHGGFAQRILTITQVRYSPIEDRRSAKMILLWTTHSTDERCFA